MTTTTLTQTSYGILCVTALALVSYFVVKTPLLASAGISSLVVAIVLGIVLGNTWSYPMTWSIGIQFAAKRLLRLAIVLYGFRVSFQQMASIGVEAFIFDIIVVFSTLLIGYSVGRKYLKLDPHLSLLVSAGAAICGAAAVLAVEDVIKSESHQSAIAIGTVVLFGTVSMLLYPLLQQMGLFGFTAHQFGLFAGASIHEVAQALIAGTNIDNETGQIAVIVKMVRVLLLIPVLILLGLFNFSPVKHNRFTHHHAKKSRLTVPWFAIGFIGIIGLHSLQLLPNTIVDAINQVDLILLTMAMGAIGMETKLNKIKKVGLGPLYLAAILYAWLMGSVFVMVKLG